MSLEDKLGDMIIRQSFETQKIMWISEKDRLAELIFCMLYSSLQIDPVLLRKLISNLEGLELLTIDKMQLLGSTNGEIAAIVKYVLRQHGLEEKDIHTSFIILSSIANILAKGYKGKLQLLLRELGEAMRNDMIEKFSGFMPDDKLRLGITHWLQNVASLPLSLEDESLRNFCTENNVKFEDVWNAADNLDLNLAFVDDLIERDQTEYRATEVNGTDEG